MNETHRVERPGWMILLLCGLTAQAACNQGSEIRKSDGPTILPAFERVHLLEGTLETANVSIGDVNRDGHLDIVLAEGRHSPFVNRVLFGNGRGEFPIAQNLGEMADRSYSALLVDIDGDSDLDIVVSNDMPDPKNVYLNDGKGTFHLGSSYGRPEWPTRNATVADLNGDYRPDIVVANRGGSGSANYVCLNRGGGMFDADCTALSDYPATTVTAADFNHDGLVDLAVPHRDGGQSYLYLNDRKVSFAMRIPFGPSDASFRMAAVADLDLDGLLDIVAIDDRRPGTFTYFGQRDGTFSAGLTVGDDAVVPYALTVGDLNSDNRIDVVVGYRGSPPTVYVNDRSGRSFIPVRFGDDAGAAYGFAIADLNSDGLLDIGLARSGAANVVYFGSAAPVSSGDTSGE